VTEHVALEFEDMGWVGNHCLELAGFVHLSPVKYFSSERNGCEFYD